MKRFLAITFIIIIAFSSISYSNAKEFSQDGLKLPRMGKVLSYKLKYRVSGYSGIIDFSVNFTKAELSDDGVKIYYAYEFSAFQQISEGSYTEYSSSGNGTTSDIVRVCLELRYFPGVICPTVALLPKTAPHFFSYRSLNSIISSEKGKYSYKVVEVEKTSRNGGLAIRINVTVASELNGSVPMSYSYLTIFYSVAYALMIEYKYKSSDDSFSLELKDYPKMDPIKPSGAPTPFKKASRDLYFEGLRYNKEFLEFHGSIDVEIQDTYDYGGGYRFFASRSGSARLSYNSTRGARTIDYKISGKGIFGYSDEYPRSIIGDTSFFVYPFIVYNKDIESSISELSKALKLSYDIKSSKVIVGDEEYDGYLVELSSNSLNITAYVLDNGLTAHLNKTYKGYSLYTGEYLIRGNARMTSITFSSHTILIAAGIIIAIAIALILYLRKTGKISFSKFFTQLKRPLL